MFDLWLAFNSVIIWLLYNSLTVVVEDSTSSCSVTVKVFPNMTTAALKQQVSLDNKKNLPEGIKKQNLFIYN